MAISVISALRPLPNSMMRPNATCIWSRSRVVWKKNGRSSVVGRFVERVRREELLAIAGQDQTAVVGRARPRALHLDRLVDAVAGGVRPGA